MRERNIRFVCNARFLLVRVWYALDKVNKDGCGQHRFIRLVYRGCYKKVGMAKRFRILWKILSEKPQLNIFDFAFS